MATLADRSSLRLLLALLSVSAAAYISCSTDSLTSLLDRGNVTGANGPPSAIYVQLAEDAAEETSPMDNRRLGKLLKKHFPGAKIEGQDGMWRIALSTKGPKKNLPTKEAPTENKQAGQRPDGEKNNGLAKSKEPELGPGGTNHLPPVLMVMTDERADRMRIMIPIRKFDTQHLEDLQLALIALQANYDRALDARYAVHDGFLWSAFIHPLGSLTLNDLSNALSQVQTLAENTGTTYTSSPLIFAPQGGQEKPQDNQGPGDSSPGDSSPGDNVT